MEPTPQQTQQRELLEKWRSTFTQIAVHCDQVRNELTEQIRRLPPPPNKPEPPKAA